jgi:toxin ParE1/3/4
MNGNHGHERGPLVLADQMIDPLAAIQQQPRGPALIFPYRPESISTAFTRGVERCAIRDLCFHDLRHHGCSPATIPPAARRLRAVGADELDRLGRYPASGTTRPELAAPPVRFWFMQRYLHVLIYDSEAKPSLVLRVVHAARDLPALLRKVAVASRGCRGRRHRW